MKKQIMLLCTLLFLSIIACKKDEIETVDEPITLDPMDKVLLQGTFMGTSYSTSGTAKLVEDKDGKKFLILEDFKTDAGPDLRLYLAIDKTASNFTEITSNVVNGNRKLDIPAAADLTTQKTVLVWCKQFSVLFGSAPLQ